MPKPNTHCSFCGHAFVEGQPWPLVCKSCKQITYRNPIPVTVMLVPIDGDGLLLVRRDIEPRKGFLALPGGYVDFGESWQAAGKREVFEETGLELGLEEIGLFDVHSTEGHTILIFGLADPHSSDELPALEDNEETSELVIIQSPQELAFGLHTQVVEDYFAQRAQDD